MEKVLSTLITVVLAVGISAGLWIGANLMFGQVTRKWSQFSAIAGAIIGLLYGVAMSGNRLIVYSDGGEGITAFAQFIWFPMLSAVIVGATALALSKSDGGARLAVGLGGGAVLGVVTGALLRSEYYPSIDAVALIGFTAAFAALGAGASLLRKRAPQGGAIIGAAIGWLLGAFGAPEVGDGTAVWGLIAIAVPPILIGLRMGLGRNPTLVERIQLDQDSRGAIFLGPALFFIFAALVVPTVRTLYLSLLDRRSEAFVGVQNYIDTFQNRSSFDASGFADLFTSRLFYIAVALLVIGLVISVREKAATGRSVEIGGPSMAPLIVGGLFFSFALFTALRGTIVNNLWWVVVVVVFSTSLGLAIAVLADNVRFEKVAKSIIFMPMALSLVGASVIWRFMYQARDTSVEQTGVLNALWVGLGRLSTGDGVATLVVGGLAVVLSIALLVVMARSMAKRDWAAAAGPGVVGLLGIWFSVRFFSNGGIGGVIPTADGFAADTILFVQESPYNSFWLMLVLVWIQTGFAMVILAAAIRAVPEDLIEAARVDGATESQIFWRITLPQIASTIGVVVTTLIVLVMKVFDIVKVMTNGQFGTQVLANDMFQVAFTNFDTGRGAALAVLILVSVLPVMIYNVRQMVAEEA